MEGYDPLLPLRIPQARIKTPLQSQADVLDVQGRQLAMRQQVQQAQEQDQLRSALQAHFAEGGTPDDMPGLLKRIYPVNPMLGMKLHQQWQQEQAKQGEASWRAQRERHDAQKARMELLQAAHGQLARVLDLPEEDQAAAYSTAVDDLINTGVADADQIPRAFDRKLVTTWRDALKKEVDRVSLHAGVLSPETGQPGMGVYEGSKLLRVDPMTPSGEKLGSDYHQFLARYAKDKHKDVNELTAAEELAARKQYGQADDAAQRPWAPVVIQTPTGPQLVNRNTGVAGPIAEGPGGSQVPPAPTSGMREKAIAFQTVKPVLESISALSEKINTGRGALAKIAGEVERGKARINLNNDVAEYESLVSGFTPMVARAVGHTGVLTEQDVQSVKALFPRPGDSKALRDRKMAQLQKIIQGVEAINQKFAPVPGGSAPAPSERKNPFR